MTFQNVNNNCPELVFLAREPKRAHLRVLVFETPPKITEKTPREGRKERILRREREKKERNFGRSWGGPGKGSLGKAGLGKGGPGGTQHDQTKTLKPTPTPHSTNTHTNTHKHTAQVELGLAKVGLARRAKPGAAAAARPRPLTSLKVRIEGGGVSCALSVD